MFESLTHIAKWLFIASAGLGVNVFHALDMNIAKLKIRYPNGFNSHDSIDRVDTTQ